MFSVYWFYHNTVCLVYLVPAKWVTIPNILFVQTILRCVYKFMAHLILYIHKYGSYTWLPSSEFRNKNSSSSKRIIWNGLRHKTTWFLHTSTWILRFASWCFRYRWYTTEGYHKHLYYDDPWIRWFGLPRCLVLHFLHNI